MEVNGHRIALPFYPGKDLQNPLNLRWVRQRGSLRRLTEENIIYCLYGGSNPGPFKLTVLRELYRHWGDKRGRRKGGGGIT